MTLDQNKRNIRWGLYLMSFAMVWGLMQIELIDETTSDAYRWFALVSLSVLVFTTFFLFIVFGLMLRYIKFLIKADILTTDQIDALKMLPHPDEDK